MADPRRWLFHELESWVADGLIEPRQATAIRRRYPEFPESPETSWGRLVLSALGAIVFGLGIILFFAYNWADMPRFAKLAVILFGLISVHGAGWWMAVRQRGSRALIEAAHLLGTMLFGAGIWLVSQMYHIDPIEPNPFAMWAIAALLTAWFLPSIPQALVGIVLTVAWSLNLWTMPWLERSLPMLVAVLAVWPLAWRHRSRLVGGFAGVATIFLLSVAVGDNLERLAVPALVSLGATYLGLGCIARIRGWRALEPLVGLGHGLYLLMLFAYGFHGVVNELAGHEPKTEWQWLWFLSAVVIALVAIGWARYLDPEADSPASAQWVVAGCVVVIAAILPFGAFGSDPWLAQALFSLALAGHGVIWILDGSWHQAWPRVLAGCSLLVLLTAARFTDLFDSLLLRSLAFLMLGGGLVVVGQYYQRFKSSAEVDHA